MPDLFRVPLQAIAYLGFAWLLGHFATIPPFHYGDPARASIKLSLNHATARIKPCVKLTQEQIAEFAANMRRTEACERARLPLQLEMDIDGEQTLKLAAEPTGLWDDGPASIYERFDAEPGAHHIDVRLRDTARAEGWDYCASKDVMLEAGKYFTVTFKAETGGFRFR